MECFFVNQYNFSLIPLVESMHSAENEYLRLNLGKMNLSPRLNNLSHLDGRCGYALYNICDRLINTLLMDSIHYTITLTLLLIIYGVAVIEELNVDK